MSLESVNVKAEKRNMLKRKVYTTAQTWGVETTQIKQAIPSISNNGSGPYSDGEVHSKIVIDNSAIGEGKVELWLKETVAEVIALDDA